MKKSQFLAAYPTTSGKLLAIDKDHVGMIGAAHCAIKFEKFSENLRDGDNINQLAIR